MLNGANWRTTVPFSTSIVEELCFILIYYVAQECNSLLISPAYKQDPSNTIPFLLRGGDFLVLGVMVS